MSGLYKKYEVTQHGEHVDECFVLRPETDEAAVAALRRYAQVTTNRELANDLWDWMFQIAGVSEDVQ